MKFEEKKTNLFNVGKEYTLAHCISSDYALGAGIAVEFSKKYHLKNKLKQIGSSIYPDCIYIDGVFNLVTKKKYWNKPTYDNLQKTLYMMKEKAIEFNITKIAMPKIGCGLDRLSWPQVREIIEEVFQNTDIEILVCSL
jgi:O-acetyl-ADP-ribose deacetylase (regulator of RNase III)